MLKDRKGPYPYPKRDVSKIPMFNYAEMDRQRQERAEQAAKKWTYTPLLGQLPKEEPHKDDAVELPLKELSASPKNAFRQLDEETYSELKASLQASGLVYPVIVRPRDSIQSYPINGEYEILAGHNRVRAARDLGWETIKASIVRVDDVQAVRIINDSNLQRTGVTELEKAWAYRQLFDAMQRQGQRTDLMAMLEGQNTMEGDDGLGAMVAQSSNGSKRTSDTIGEVCGLPDTVSESSKRETVDTIGEMYGQSGRTVRRKIRLTYLIDELYRLYERKDISQGAAVDLSYRNKTASDIPDGKVCAYEVLNRKELLSFHGDLKLWLLQNGLDANVNSGITVEQGGNRTVAELKQEREQQREQQHTTTHEHEF